MSELLEAALGYARRGFPVFPVTPGGKLPLIGAAHRDGDPLHGVCKGECGQDGHGLHDATIDLDRIRAWWRQWPQANIGVRTGVAFDVLDLDGAEGAESMRAFCEEHGVSLAGVPWVRTPGGGWHYFFEPTGLGNRAGFLERVDWRGEGGYIVAGPSVHPSGGLYRPIPPEADRPPWVPAPLRELLEPPAPPPAPRATFRPGSTGTAYARAVLDGTHRRILAAELHTRNDTAFRECFKLFGYVAGGVVDEAEAVRAATDAMAAVGLPAREVSSVIRSARARGSQVPRGIPADPPAPRPVPVAGAVLSEDAWTAAANGKPMAAPCPNGAPPGPAPFPSTRSRELYRTLEWKSRIDGQGRRVQENVSHEHLMRHYRVGRATVENELRRLERLGYLRRERIPAERGAGGRVVGKRNRYVLRLDPIAVQNATVEEFTVPYRSQGNIEVAPCPKPAAVRDENHGTPVITSNHGEGGGVPPPVGGGPPVGLDDDLAAALGGLGSLGGELLEVRPNDAPTGPAPPEPTGWRWRWQPEPAGPCARCALPANTLGADGRPWHAFCWDAPSAPTGVGNHGRRLDGSLEDFHRAVDELAERDTCRALNGAPARCGAGLRCGRHTRRRRTA